MIPQAAVACAVAVVFAGCQQPTSAGPADQLSVTHVTDGDTISGQDGAGQRVRVRVLGIDAPELAHDGKPAQCGAEAARDALRSLVLHQRVTLTNDPRADQIDRYGRRLAYVDLGGLDVALHQVEAGYAAAWHPRSEARPARHANYQDAERAAQKASAGAWASCAHLGR